MTDKTDTSTDFMQAEEFVIQDLDTLKVVADPLRLQIVELIFDHAHTVKQIAKKLSLPPSKLYYHINLLEKHNVITIVSTRIVSGIVEKSYMTSARGIRVQKGLLTPNRAAARGDESMDILVGAILEDTRQDIHQNNASGLIDPTGEAEHLSLRISRSTTRFTPEQTLAFQERLHELVEEFKQKKSDPANQDEQVYAFVFAFYPTARGERPPAGDGQQDETDTPV